MENHQPKMAFNVLRIIHWALAVAPTAFAVVVYIQINQGNISPIMTDQIILYLPVIFFTAMIPLSDLVFKSKLASDLKQDDLDLSAKLRIYQINHLIRMSLIEFSCILAVVVCFITTNIWNLVVLPLTLIIFFMRSPTAFKLENELGLSQAEKTQLGESF